MNTLLRRLFNYISGKNVQSKFFQLGFLLLFVVVFVEAVFGSSSALLAFHE